MSSVEIPPRPDAPLPVGISQCLVGDEVRYDGSGAKSSCPHAALDGLFEYHTICPEVGIGMSIPREPIRLVGTLDGARVVGVKDPSIDKTDDLVGFAQRQLPKIDTFSGYIFMHNSPSCGVHSVKLYTHTDAPPSRKGRGAFAATVMQERPCLPVEDAGRLFDDVYRDNFVTRVFAYAHFRLIQPNITAANLIEFHSRYKYLLMAHSQLAYQEAGRLLSDLRDEVDTKADQYLRVLMSGLAKPAKVKGHANVMSHLQGYLKRHLDSASRQELDALISEYRRGEQPLLAPLALLRHHFRRHPDEYILKQSYLEPHPPAAALRRPL